MGFDSFGLPAEQYALKQASILQLLQKKILQLLKTSWIKLVFVTTGAVKYEPVIRNIIDGHNGYFCKYLIAGIIIKMKKAECN